MGQKDPNPKPFLTDVKTLRERARKNLADGAVTSTYGGDVAKTIELLQSVLATEIVCVLRYSMHAVAAEGISSEGVRSEFAQHAKEEREHAHKVADRINQLGGTPNFNPEGLASRSASEYGHAETLVEMIEENLVAERIAIEHYQELIRYFGDADPGTRLMLEEILVVEEEHASDMHDLLIDQRGEVQQPTRARTARASNGDEHREALLDEAGKESFPASDSPSVGASR